MRRAALIAMIGSGMLRQDLDTPGPHQRPAPARKGACRSEAERRERQKAKIEARRRERQDRKAASRE